MALTVEQLTKMLQIPAEKVREHVDSGAPTDADQRINLVHYTAWLNRELARSGLVTAEPEAKTDGD